MNMDWNFFLRNFLIMDVIIMEKMPNGMKYWYIDEKSEQWRIMDDAPTWAKQEFEEFQENVNPKPNEDGVVTQY